MQALWDYNWGARVTTTAGQFSGAAYALLPVGRIVLDALSRLRSQVARETQHGSHPAKPKGLSDRAIHANVRASLVRMIRPANAVAGGERSDHRRVGAPRRQEGTSSFVTAQVLCLVVADEPKSDTHASTSRGSTSPTVSGSR